MAGLASWLGAGAVKAAWQTYDPKMRPEPAPRPSVSTLLHSTCTAMHISQFLDNVRAPLAYCCGIRLPLARVMRKPAVARCDLGRVCTPLLELITRCLHYTAMG